MTQRRKTPVRTCVGCGISADKRELTRVVRNTEGEVALDLTGKANGRGAYLHQNAECFETAVRRRKIASALRVSLREEDIETLRRDFEEALALPPSRQGR